MWCVCVCVCACVHACDRVEGSLRVVGGLCCFKHCVLLNVVLCVFV